MIHLPSGGSTDALADDGCLAGLVKGSVNWMPVGGHLHEAQKQGGGENRIHAWHLLGTCLEGTEAEEGRREGKTVEEVKRTQEGEQGEWEKNQK